MEWKLPPRKYHEYIKSAQWQQRASAMKMHTGYRCENCGKSRNLTVHHLNYDHLGDERIEDLKVLCWECHREEHRGRNS